MRPPSMPVSLHCPLCLTVTVPGSSIIVDPPDDTGWRRITAVCPQCTRHLHVRVREGLELARVLMCGARTRLRADITPAEKVLFASGDWDEAAVEELMM